MCCGRRYTLSLEKRKPIYCGGRRNKGANETEVRAEGFCLKQAIYRYLNFFFLQTETLLWDLEHCRQTAGKKSTQLFNFYYSILY